MQFPAREDQLVLIKRYLASTSKTPLYLHGSYHTGKRATFQQAIPSFYKVQTIDCVLHSSDRQLFSAILGVSCGSDISLFLSRLSTIENLSNRIILLQRADRLSLPPFSSLSITALLTLSPIRLVLLCRLPWPSFRATLGVSYTCKQPYQIYFSCYSEVQIIQAILINATKYKEDERFESFVKLVVSVLYPTTADVRELYKVVIKLYPDYLNACKDGNFKPIVAFNRVRDRLAACLYSLYRVERLLTYQKNNQPEQQQQKQMLTVPDLGKTGKCLLIAAYLASRNNPQYDTRYFTIESTRRNNKSRSGGISKGRKKMGITAEGNLKPIMKNFPLERLLAIYQAIRPDDMDIKDIKNSSSTTTSISAALSTASLVQISSLVTLRLLSRDGGTDMIQDPKFRCNLDLEMIQKLARELGIELSQYLHKE